MHDILDDGFRELATDRGRKYFVATINLLLGMICLSGVISAYDVESIIATGPLCCFFGIVHLFSTGKGARVYGVLPLAFSFVCYVLIEALNWSPRDAQIPITLLIFLFALLMLILRKWLLHLNNYA